MKLGVAQQEIIVALGMTKDRWLATGMIYECCTAEPHNIRRSLRRMEELGILESRKVPSHLMKGRTATEWRIAAGVTIEKRDDGVHAEVGEVAS